MPLSTHAPAPALLSVCYHFVQGGAHSPPPLSPRSSSGASDASSLSRESSVRAAPRFHIGSAPLTHAPAADLPP